MGTIYAGVGEVMTYTTGDANLYVDLIAQVDSSGNAIIGADNTTNFALGVVAGGWKDGYKGTSGDPYGSGIDIAVIKKGICRVPVQDGEDIAVADRLVKGSSGTVRKFLDGTDDPLFILGVAEEAVASASGDSIKANINTTC